MGTKVDAVLRFPGRAIWTVAVVGLSIGLGYVGYRLIRADLQAAVYRDRLQTLARDYQSLAETYNDAVRRTAVTELVVEKDRLDVVIRTAEGVLQSIPTGLDPAREIYVDYAVLDGRLWIRRVFDASTPPEKGVVIDPAIASVDWRDDSASYGQAVYRSLTQGRWMIAVSGDGALSLKKSDADRSLDLAHRPAIRSFEEIQAETDRRLREISLADVWELLTP